MADTFKVNFPLGAIYSDGSKILKLEYNKQFVNQLNRNGNKVQIYLDNKVISELQKYVSKKTGIQEASIRLSTIPGLGYVNINVPYAEYQAYSTRITKKVGLRGTRPFERMKADKKDSILKQVEEYSRRLVK